MAKRPQGFRARFQLPAKDDGETDDIAMERADGEPMTDEELAALVDGQINDAKNYESSDLTQLREKALKYFEGEVDIPAAPGRSSVVSRDVADTHGLILPGLMRVFLATDNIAIYEPKTQADEKFARQATDYVNYVVMKECEGYSQFRSAFHDGLLMGNGILKHWWDQTLEYDTESFSGLSDDAYTMLVNDSDVDEVIEHTEYDDPDWVAPPPALPMMGDMGDMGQAPPAMPEAPKLHDCKLKRVTSRGRLRLMALPPEDLLLGRGVIELDEERTRFVAHRWIKTRSALIKEGFDPDEVDELPAYSSAKLDTPEELARDRHHLYEGDIAPDRTVDLVEGYECYVQCDYDGDGIAEWRKVNVSGLGGEREVLSNEEWGDDLPFSVVVPDPVPHRWRGRSLFDATEDIQRVKTVLWRQTLDNIYMNNVPRQIAAENQIVNPESINDFEIGTTIWTRGDVNSAISHVATPFTADKTGQLLEYADQIIEKRTGISRASMALDLDALSDQTATAVNANQAAAYTKIEEYARNIAEYGGLKRVFAKILKLICKHQDRARTIRLRDGWIEVDPRAWNANMDVVVNTGLGSGSRDRDLTMLAQIAVKQEQLVLNMGITNPICGIDKLLDTYRLMTEAAGLKPAERFFPEISPEIMQQLAQQAANPPPDPKVQVAQMQAQLEDQSILAQAQIEMQKLQQKADLDRQQAVFEQQMEQAKAQRESEIEAFKAQREAELQQLLLERQAQVEERQAQADVAVKQVEAEHKMQLSQMQFEFDTKLAMLKAENDRKAKLLDIWAKCNGCGGGEGGDGSKGPGAGNAELEDMLVGGGVELPDGMAMIPGPLASAVKQIADSQAQLGQMIAQMGQHMAHGHAENAKMIAGAMMESNKPKRQKVLRDEKNRVIGMESVQ